MVRKILLLVTALIYGYLLTYIVFLAPERTTNAMRQQDRLRLFPLKSTLDDLLYYRGNDWGKHLLFFSINFIGNICLFIPFPFMLLLLFRISQPKWLIGLAFLTSVFIEIMQYRLGLGVADVDDVILNTAGAAAGVYLCRNFLRTLNHSTDK